MEHLGIKNMHLSSITEVFDVLRDHLRSRLDQLACFGKHEFQAEAWPRDFIFGLEDEFEKLNTVKAGDRAWIAALCTTTPGADAWAGALEELNRENAPWAVEPIDRPTSYPSSYFLGLLHVRGLDASL